MRDRKQRHMLVVRPDETNTKGFVYFTYYGKLMEVIRENHIILVERSLKEEFPNTVYRNSLEDVLREAAVN
jgi:acyl-CoA thioesterase FadM